MSDCLEDMRAERDRLREALAAVEWGGDSGRCPACWAPEGYDHDPHCILRAALAATEPKEEA